MQVDLNSQKEIELENCTFAKTVLMLLIVLYHSILYYAGNWFVGTPSEISKPLSLLSSYFNSFHIYAFVFISGYIFYYLKCERDKYTKFGPFIANKAKRLLVPYVFVSLLWVIPIGLLFYEWDFWTVFKNYALAMRPSQLWFLIMLFGVFVIAWPLTKIFKERNILGVFIALCFWGVSVVGAKYIPNVFGVWTTCAYVVFFYLGFKTRQYSNLNVKRIPFYVWIVLHALLFVISELISGNDNTLVKLAGILLTLMLHLTGAIMAFTTLVWLGSRIRWEHSKVFDVFSKNSMVIYLLHQQVIYFSIFLLNGLINPYLNAAINLAVSLLVSTLLSILLMRFKVTRFMVGEK